MSASAPPPQQDPFNRYIGISFAFHIALVLCFTINAVFFEGEPIEYQAAVRVDLVGLPDKIKPEDVTPAPAAPTPPQPKPAEPEPQKAEAPKPEPKPEPEAPKVKQVEKKVETKDPDAINLDKRKVKTQDALNRLKAMSALEKMEEEVAADSKKSAQTKPAAPSKPIKGNEISSGSQLTGLAKIQADTFISDVEQKIRQNWALPQWLAKKNLSAQIRVRFDQNGNILAAQIVKSSGNPAFDDIVVDTVHKSAPLPAPPEKFVRLMSTEGILFGFPE